MRSWRFLPLLLAGAIALMAGGEGRAAGECRGQSPGVPGPSYVYFTVGSSKLDAAAKSEIAEVAARIKALFVRDVCLLGSADKQGDEKTNFALSVKRAEAVAAALVREGVERGVIRVVGKGETFGDWLELMQDNQQDRSVKITLTR